MTNKQVCEQIFESQFFDFSNGVNISLSETYKWIEECIENCADQMRNSNLQSVHSNTSSGNTRVTVTMYRQDDGLITVSVTKTKNYQAIMTCNIEL